MLDEEHNRKEQAALARFTFISSLLHSLPRGEQARILRHLVTQEIDVPGIGPRRYSIRTLKRILARARKAKGFKDLLPPLRKHAGTCRIPPEILERAKALKREIPQRSAETIIFMLENAPENPVPSGLLKPSTLRRHLAKAGFTRKALLHPEPTGYTRWQKDRPGALWQGDATPGLYIPDPDHPGKFLKTTLFGFIDDATRFVPFAAFYVGEDQFRLDDCFRRAVLAWGTPERLYVDRGSVYISHHFQRVTAELKVHLIKATAYYPEGKGKIEAWWSTVQDEVFPELTLLIRDGKAVTVEDLNSYLHAWIQERYHQRPHSETQKPPAKASLPSSGIVTRHQPAAPTSGLPLPTIPSI